jgi:ribosomal protein L37E
VGSACESCSEQVNGVFTGRCTACGFASLVGGRCV